jgi:hypothetical protein
LLLKKRVEIFQNLRDLKTLVYLFIPASEKRKDGFSLLKAVSPFKGIYFDEGRLASTAD